MKTALYRAIASRLRARENCQKSKDPAAREWIEHHLDAALALAREHLPDGSGFDSGSSLEATASTSGKLVFCTAYHHLHESGMYDGWTDHTVIVTPSLAHGFEIRVTGRDRNGIKDYIAECFDAALREEIDS